MIPPPPPPPPPRMICMNRESGSIGAGRESAQSAHWVQPRRQDWPWLAARAVLLRCCHTRTEIHAGARGGMHMMRYDGMARLCGPRRDAALMVWQHSCTELRRAAVSDLSESVRKKAKPERRRNALALRTTVYEATT